jgi:hypothetical protein
VLDEKVQIEFSCRDVHDSGLHKSDLEPPSICICANNHSLKSLSRIMSSSILNWDSAPSGVDNNDAGSWLPIQSKKKQSKPTQQIPDGSGKSTNLPYNKQFEKSAGNGSIASAIRRPAKPVDVSVRKLPPQVKKAESAIPLKNVVTQARSTVLTALPISTTVIAVPVLGLALKSVKISPSIKAGKEIAKSFKDDTGIYDLMMFVKAPNGNTKIGQNAMKSVYSRDGKSVLGHQAMTKKPTEVNQEFVKHRFLQGKQKKKIFSKIKKRILMVSHFCSELFLSLSSAFFELSWYRMLYFIIHS